MSADLFRALPKQEIKVQVTLLGPLGSQRLDQAIRALFNVGFVRLLPPDDEFGTGFVITAVEGIE